MSHDGVCSNHFMVKFPWVFIVVWFVLSIVVQFGPQGGFGGRADLEKNKILTGSFKIMAFSFL